MFLTDRLNISTQRQYTDEGFLQVPAHISRTGIQTYLAAEMGLTDREPTVIVKVYRPPEEVFKPESLQSFQHKPVTDDHPPELVNASNAKRYAVGFSSNEVAQDGELVKTTLRVTDAEAIKKIEQGKVELSNGYTADIEWTKGVTQDGEKYDAVQRNIRGNHIAIVKQGRAGSTCRVADSKPSGVSEAMAKITIDGVDYEVSEQAAQAVGKLERSLNDAKNEAQTKAQKLKDSAKDLETAKAQLDETKTQLDELKKSANDAEKLDQLVADRMALVDSVKKIAPSVKWQGVDSNELIRKAVAEKRPSVNLDGKSDDYVKALFDMLCDSEDSNSQEQLDNEFTKQATTDSGDEVDTRTPSQIAREKFLNDSRNAWKNNGGAS